MQVRSPDRQPAHRQAARQQPAELTGSSPARVRRARAHHLPVPLCRRHLNKGESLHALRRDLFFAHQGHLRRRHLDDRVDQIRCLTLVTNAAVLWTMTYLG
ncbi:MAG: hypothetical protein DLM58_17695 [Pseudonocardiales bacterium]|nr:MAG: hypothetical protein DLM58_17695 [Pseudonocardiales bacterium]